MWFILVYWSLSVFHRSILKIKSFYLPYFLMSWWRISQISLFWSFCDWNWLCEKTQFWAKNDFFQKKRVSPHNWNFLKMAIRQYYDTCEIKTCFYDLKTHSGMIKILPAKFPATLLPSPKMNFFSEILVCGLFWFIGVCLFPRGTPYISKSLG